MISLNNCGNVDSLKFEMIYDHDDPDNEVYTFEIVLYATRFSDWGTGHTVTKDAKKGTVELYTYDNLDSYVMDSCTFSNEFKDVAPKLWDLGYLTPCRPCIAMKLSMVSITIEPEGEGWHPVFEFFDGIISATYSGTAANVFYYVEWYEVDGTKSVAYHLGSPNTAAAVAPTSVQERPQ